MTDSEGDIPSRESGAPRNGEVELVSVWSRTEPKYRIRAVVLLLVNLALFCGLCIFLYWLREGRVDDYSLESYLRPSRFWDQNAPNLYDFTISPISVERVPLHAFVLGLSMAVVVGVPIVVSILYRFSSAVPFLAAVLVFTHMPWMALTLLGGCILASVRPFRLNFRFGAALVGLTPVLLYLFLAARGSPDQIAQYGSPTQQSLLIVPWVLTILGAAAMFGAVLSIARVVNYRPGAVAPVLAVMFTLPVALFHLGVGSDELAYRVLLARYGPRSPRFQPAQPARDTEDSILRLVAGAMGNPSYTGRNRNILRAVWRDEGNLAELKDLIRRSFLTAFLTDRAEAYEACKNFIADYPGSRYVPCALYIQARMLDTRLDETRLDIEPDRELYDDFPHVQSAEIWLKLRTNYPESPLAVAAGWNLAQLHLRAGKTDGAVEALQFALQAGRGDHADGLTTQPSSRGLLSTEAPEASLDFEDMPYRRDARQLLELIAENRDDPEYGDRPLRELFSLDRRRVRYREELLYLAAQYHSGRLYDNLVLRWVDSIPDLHERAAALRTLVAALAGGDALPEAMYRLASLQVQALARENEEKLAEGVAGLQEIARRFPDSCWGQWAQERLAVLQPRTASAEIAVRP